MGLEVCIEEKMPQNAEEMGKLFREGLKALNSPRITEIRGLGLMNAVVIKKSDGEGGAKEVVDYMRDNGVLGRGAGDTIKMAPPLTISKEEIEKAVRLIGEACERL